MKRLFVDGEVTMVTMPAVDRDFTFLFCERSTHVHHTRRPPRREEEDASVGPVVLAMFERATEVDVTDVSPSPGPVYTRPGAQAYRIVAADVLGYLWHQGALVRHGAGNSATPSAAASGIRVPPVRNRDGDEREPLRAARRLGSPEGNASRHVGVA